MSKKRSKGRPTSQTATASTPEGELSRHLAYLGLESANDYRAWCRQHGFGTATNKDWKARRAERQAAEKEQAKKKAETARQEHLKSLGLTTPEEYSAWCVRHSFADTLNKTGEQRVQERLAAVRERTAASLRQAKYRERRPEDVLRSLASGIADAETLRTPYLLKTQDCFAGLGKTGEEASQRKAFLHLLLHIHKHANLFGLEPVILEYGPQAGNTFIEGILALACHHRGWLRPLVDWRPDSHNAHRQFGSLARHLLAYYDVPDFMDAAWFRSDPVGLRQQGWFRHIGRGQNIRTADLPVHLTKKAAHYLLQAPPELSIEAAFRWGQIHALGGDEYLVRTLLGTRLREMQSDESFWATVLHFFVNHRMIEPSRIGPMVDYIHTMRFVLQQLPGVEGDGTPSEPAFSIKGRTPEALWRRVEAWHQELRRASRKTPLAWPVSGLEGFEREVEDREAGTTFRWTVEELLDKRSLVEEGKEMRHCVASYAASCARGQTSIWSIRVADCKAGTQKRVMTVEVHNARRCIVQARGRCNKEPGDKRSSVRLNQAPIILRQWASKAGLNVPSYIK